MHEFMLTKAFASNAKKGPIWKDFKPWFHQITQEVNSFISLIEQTMTNKYLHLPTDCQINFPSIYDNEKPHPNSPKHFHQEIMDFFPRPLSNFRPIFIQLSRMPKWMWKRFANFMPTWAKLRGLFLGLHSQQSSFLHGKSLDFGGDTGLDLSKFLISTSVP